jgi:hypothetical protein
MTRVIPTLIAPLAFNSRAPRLIIKWEAMRPPFVVVASALAALLTALPFTLATLLPLLTAPLLPLLTATLSALLTTALLALLTAAALLAALAATLTVLAATLLLITHILFPPVTRHSQCDVLPQPQTQQPVPIFHIFILLGWCPDQHDGSLTSRGDLIINQLREAGVFGDDAAKVGVITHDEKAGHRKPSIQLGCLLRWLRERIALILALMTNFVPSFCQLLVLSTVGNR